MRAVGLQAPRTHLNRERRGAWTQLGPRAFLRRTAGAGAAGCDGVELEGAMDRVAELIKKTRDETFIEKIPNGKLVNMTPALFALGGATLDNEFNHVCQKFWRGLGVVAIENQARI